MLPRRSAPPRGPRGSLVSPCAHYTPRPREQFNPSGAPAGDRATDVRCSGTPSRSTPWPAPGRRVRLIPARGGDVESPSVRGHADLGAVTGSTWAARYARDTSVRRPPAAEQPRARAARSTTTRAQSGDRCRCGRGTRTRESVHAEHGNGRPEADGDGPDGFQPPACRTNRENFERSLSAAARRPTLACVNREAASL